MLDNAKAVNSTTADCDVSQRKHALDGLWNTLITTANAQEMKSYLRKSPTVMEKVIPNIVNSAVQQYEHSQKNMIRSVGVLYEGGISSKKQFNRKRSREVFEMDTSGKKHQITYMPACKVPKLVDYKGVMKFVNTVDIGDVKEIQRAKKFKFDKGKYQKTADDEDDFHPAVAGCYRDLESFLIKLAGLYLSIDSKRPGFLTWFGHEKGSFLVAIGADGAPFGKHNEATSWLLSFLNVGERVASCYENHLIFGANCPEEHPAVIEYGRQLRKDIEKIEQSSYVIENQIVTFAFELLPADMKWLAFISGELPNSAKYFSSFADVSTDTIQLMGRTCGGPSDYFKPWNYQHRVKVTQKVEAFKSKLTPKQLSARTKVTEFIASQKSRQEFEPILGPFVNKALAEPLHLANNNWQFLFTELFTFVLHSKTKIPSSAVYITDLPDNCALRKFLLCLKKEVKANRLYKAILRWFREGRKSGSPFNIRFTGEETRLMCNGFCKLAKCILENDPNPASDSSKKGSLKVYVLAFMALNLRDAVAIFSRITNMNEDLLVELEKCCTSYFNAASLFLRVTVSVWTLGYIVPVHTKQVFTKYGVSLGINTMQGREAKHQRLAEYAKNTTFKDRWCQIFRHEYMTLIWLREQNPYRDDYCKTKFKYVPTRCSTDDFCHCGLLKSSMAAKCKICMSAIMKDINLSVQSRKVCASLKSLSSKK